MNTLYIILASLILFFILGDFHRRKRAKSRVVHVVDNQCTGCKRCMKRCHHKVLDLVDDSTGAHIAVEYPERCTACGDCVTVCKFNALELIDRSNKRNNR